MNTLTAVILFVCSLTGSFLAEEKSIANFFLAYFPNKIPGACKIDKIPHSNAEYCIVHIRALKWQQINCYDDKIDEQGKDIIIRAQYDILSIINYLFDENSLRELYCEGFADDEKKLADLLKKEYGELEICGFFEELSGVRKNAVDILKKERKICLKPAEKSEEFFAALKFLFFGGAGDLSTVMADREDAFLRIVDENKERLAVVLYGGEHDFRNNIEEWNKKYLNKKISLIVVTPSIYEEYSKWKK